MRTLYLIRHTTPAIEPGFCYGQSDIDVAASFHEEASAIKACLPEDVEGVYSSPLKRCRKLAEYLFAGREIVFNESLMEISCGWWEMRRWNDIPKDETDPWMNDFVRVRIPGGESYTDLHKRATQSFNGILESCSKAVVVTHGGVIRSILTHITKIPLEDSFNRFSISCGSVIKISGYPEDFRFDILSGSTVRKEMHRPG